MCSNIGVQDVTTTIEKCGMEENRELQWSIQNFDIIHSSSLNVIRQNFGPLNGKVLIKLDLTKLSNGDYELGAQIEPMNNVVWVNLQFKLHGDLNREFSISGNPKDVPSNRLTYKLNIPPQNTLKFTFKPEILLSTSNVCGEPQTEQPNQQIPNAQEPNASSSGNPWLKFVQHILNQRIAEGQHWIDFFRNYPTELAQLQQTLYTTIINSELIKESPRMLQSLFNELSNNPEYASLNQRVQDLLNGARRQCENLRTHTQQNQQSQPTPNANQAHGEFPPLMQSIQELLQQQMPTQQQLQTTLGAVQNVVESAMVHPFTQSYIDRYRNEFPGLQQQFQNMMDQIANLQNHQQFAQPNTQPEQQPNSQPEQPEQQQTEQQPTQEEVNEEPIINVDFHAPEPIIEIEQQIIETPTVNAVVEESVVEAEQSTPIMSEQRSSTSPTNDWSFVFKAKGITGFVRAVKNMGQRVPYNRNFCSAENWTLPDGNAMKVELAYALHPDAPFICLLDYNHVSDMAFVQSLLDGEGNLIHKIDSFSDSYHGFTCDQLLESAQADDCVRIKIEAIPNMD